MSVERLDLPDDQWADLERRPTRGTIRLIAKESERRAKGDSLAPEDVIVSAICKDWRILDADGKEVPFRPSDFDRVPQEVFSLVSDECLTIVESAYPNRGAAR
jgi:hypothetical protein